MAVRTLFFYTLYYMLPTMAAGNVLFYGVYANQRVGLSGM